MSDDEQWYERTTEVMGASNPGVGWRRAARTGGVSATTATATAAPAATRPFRRFLGAGRPSPVRSRFVCSSVTVDPPLGRRIFVRAGLAGGELAFVGTIDGE